MIIPALKLCCVLFVGPFLLFVRIIKIKYCIKLVEFSVVSMLSFWGIRLGCCLILVAWMLCDPVWLLDSKLYIIYISIC